MSGNEHETSQGVVRGKVWLMIAAVSCIVAVAVSVMWWRQMQPLPIPLHLQNMGGDFTLQSADGPVALQDFRGKVVLIYFGYSHCPDACPMTMSNWARALKSLSGEELSRVQGLLISVDPERDTPEMLMEYTTFFHPNILGVTGSHEDLRKVSALYRSDYETESDAEHSDNDAENYMVAHMSFVYVIDPEGKLRGLLSHDSPQRDVVDQVRNALRVQP